MQRSRFKKLSGPFSALILYVTTSCCQSANAVITHDQGRFTQSVKIGNTSAADSTAALDIVSITKGVLFPRMTTTQRTAISSPPTGLTVYDTDLASYMVFNSTWKALVDVSASQTLSNKSISGDANTVSNLGIGTLKTVIGNATKFLSFDGTGAPVATKAVPTGVVVGDTDTQTLTSKTLTSPIISTISNTGTLTLPTSTDTLVGRATADTLTNKTLTIPNINGANFNFGTATNTSRLLLPNASTVGLAALTPTAGLIAYDNTQSKPVYNDGSGWTTIGAGSGAGAREYISNTNAETSTTGWSTYADAAATSPVDGTGGTATNLTFSRTTTTSEIIRETASFKLAKSAANAQGMGVSTDFALDPQDYKGVAPIYVSFDYATSANYAAGDIKVFAFDKDFQTPLVITVLDGPGLNGALPAAPSGGRFTGVFYPQTTIDVNYRLIFHVASTNATAYNFFYDNVHVGGANIIPGAIVTAWQSFTPTGSWTTNTTYSGQWRRVGDTMEVQTTVYLAGAPTAASLTVNLPSGYTIDTTKLANGTGTLESFGNVMLVTGGGAAAYSGGTYYNSTTSVLLRSSQSSGGAVVTVNATTPGTFTNAFDAISVFYRVPIVGWTSGSQVSTGELALQTPAPQTASSAVKTPTATDRFHALSGNSITLGTGTYDLSGTCNFDSNGASFAGYTDAYCSWFSANGTDTTSVPAALSAATNLTLLSGTDVSRVMPNSQPYAVVPAQARRVKCASACTVYLGTYATMTTAANARISTQLTASRVTDFTLYGVVPSAQISVGYSNTAGTSISAAAITGIPFATREFDLGAWFNGTTFTCPQSGKYRFTVGLVTAANSLGTTQNMSIQLFKGGSFFKIIGATIGNGASSIRPVNGAITVPLVAGDTLDIRAFSDVATTLLTNAGYNHLEIEKVAD